MKKLPLMVIAVLCFFFTNCHKKDCPPIVEPGNEMPIIDPKITAFTDSLTALYQRSVIPGFAISVIDAEETVYQEAFGQADIAKAIKYTNQTTQPIGSVSKTFIGAAIMKAIEQGHFTMETDINDLLPFNIINPNFPDSPIKVKQLVTHTSGYQDGFEAFILNYYILEGEDLSLPSAQLLLSLDIPVHNGIPLGDYLVACYTPEGALYNQENFIPAASGTVYSYSNITSSLAAYLIEVTTQKRFADYIKEHIFDPLNMKNSAYQRSELDQQNLATLYLSKDYPLPEYSHPSYPDGFVNTSNEELAIYLKEMMKGYAGNGSILSKESYQTLFTRQTPITITEGEIHSVFWGLRDSRIEHDGSDPGVIAIISFNPTTNTGYQVMLNINESDLGEALEIDADMINGQISELLKIVRAFEENL